MDANEAPPTAAPPAAQTSGANVDTVMLQRLKGLNEDYKTLIQNADGNASKMRR